MTKDIMVRFSATTNTPYQIVYDNETAAEYIEIYEVLPILNEQHIKLSRAQDEIAELELKNKWKLDDFIAEHFGKNKTFDNFCAATELIANENKKLKKELRLERECINQVGEVLAASTFNRPLQLISNLTRTRVSLRTILTNKEN